MRHGTSEHLSGPLAENHGAVAFLDVPLGSRGYELLNQVVPRVDSPVFYLTASGNISAVFLACSDREIQSGSIGASLAA
jgi:hypothetical protein